MWWFKRFTFDQLVVLGTGLRISEALGITWDDIDFENKCVNVNHQIVYKKLNGISKHRVCPTKTKETRIVPMQDEIIKILQQHKKETYLMSRLNDYTVDGLKTFVFLNKEMKLYTPNTFTRALHELQEAYNREVEDEDNAVILPNFAAHTLRHTYCTRMAENGCDIKVLQEIMGHKNIAVTMQVYNHVSNDRTIKEVQKLNSIMTNVI